MDCTHLHILMTKECCTYLRKRVWAEIASAWVGLSTMLWAFKPLIFVREEISGLRFDHGPIAKTTTSPSTSFPSTTTPTTCFSFNFTSCTSPISNEAPYRVCASEKILRVKSCGWTWAFVDVEPIEDGVPAIYTEKKWPPLHYRNWELQDQEIWKVRGILICGREPRTRACSLKSTLHLSFQVEKGWNFYQVTTLDGVNLDGPHVKHWCKILSQFWEALAPVSKLPHGGHLGMSRVRALILWVPSQWESKQSLGFHQMLLSVESFPLEIPLWAWPLWTCST